MLNKIVLMGRLVADPELRQTPSNISVVQFRIAVDRNFTSNGERQADFITIVAWRQTADFVARYFKKGQMIAIEGSLQSRNYTDQQNNKRTAYEVLADRVHFCGSKSETVGDSINFSDTGSIEAPPKFEQPAKEGESFSVGDLSKEAQDIDSFEETNDDELPF